MQIACCRNLQLCCVGLSAVYKAHKVAIKRAFYLLLIAAYLAYFFYAMYYEFGSQESITLLWITCAVVAGYAISFVRKGWGEWLSEHVLAPPIDFIKRHWLPFKV